MRIVIIGSGNVGHVLGKKFFEAGHDIIQVVGRNRDAVHELAILLQAGEEHTIGQVTLEADLYLFAITDDALQEMASKFHFSSGVVAHTAGSVKLDVLKNVSTDYGVFYPLQTLRKNVATPDSIPILLDGNTDHTKELLEQLARSISQNVSFADDDQRSRLHLAATIVNNFSNHLFALAYNFCKKENLDFSVLIPLIRQMTLNLGEQDPALLQTGPATREDLGTMEKHLALLEKYPALKSIYALLSQSIMTPVGENIAGLEGGLPFLLRK